MADEVLGELHDLVGNAAMQHQLAAEDEERDGQEREDVHPRHHLLEDHRHRQAFIQNGADGREADGEGDGDAENQEAEEGGAENDQFHDGMTSSPRRRAMMCSIEKETIRTPEATSGT